MSSTSSEPQSTGVRDGLKPGTDSVIRYSREFLMECAKSPLVERPEALPPTLIWFGEIVKEEPEVNNAATRKPASKTTLPGPPKMSFASSSLGGLKRSEDGLSGFKKALDTPRESRTPRGPPSALEQGFGRETIEKLSSNKLPKVTPKDITGLLSGMDRRRPDPSRSGNSTLTGSRTSTTTSTSRLGASTRTSGQSLSSSSSNPLGSLSGSSLGLGLGSRMQKLDAPEWMSYNPDSESTSKDGEGSSEPQVFVDDIQAWKARMKEHERREKEKEMSAQNQRDGKPDHKGPSRADSSSSWRSSAAPVESVPSTTETKQTAETKAVPILDKPLGRALLSSEPIQDIDMFFSPGALDLSKPFDSSSAFDKFLSQHTVAASTYDDSVQQKPTRKADGSRFARFFTEDEPEPVKDAMQPPPHISHDMPGKQLSLDQLFQAHTPSPSSISASISSSIPPPPLGRMPSEAEILESLKVNKSPAPAKPVESNEQSEDAFTFSKIMAALAKPPVSNPDSVAFGSPVSSRVQAQQVPTNAPEPALSSTQSTGTTSTLHDPSIVALQSKPTLLDTLRRPSQDSSSTLETARVAPLSTASESSHTQGSSAATATTSPSTPSSETTRPASRPVQVAFGGGIPTSVYRQLSGKTDGQKSSSPLIRPLSSVNGTSINGGASPSLSSPPVGSPRQFNTQAAIAPQQTQQQSSSQIQSSATQLTQPGMQPHQQLPPTSQPSQPMNKSFGPVPGTYGQGPGHVHHSPVMDPRMGGMYGNGAPSPMGGPGHVLEGEPPGFFNGMAMQRPGPGQGVPPQFAQQMPPFTQQMHVSGPGDYMAPHPSQFVGMPPFVAGPPMHPGMFPMNPVEMLMRGGPGGPPPPRPMPGMGPGPGPNHFVPNSFGHPMNGIPRPGMAGVPLNAPFFPPQVSKPMMSREEFDRRHRQ
ncbi:hypothetical protein EDD11_008859 [Mortierella claussenii]|nr:hypothetical protein EDD11_008859 [Mortierella claussenii]